MTSQEKSKIIELNNQGLGYSKIAATLNLSLNTVKSYIQRWAIKLVLEMPDLEKAAKQAADELPEIDWDELPRT